MVLNLRKRNTCLEGAKCPKVISGVVLVLLGRYLLLASLRIQVLLLGEYTSYKDPNHGVLRALQGPIARPGMPA